MWVFRHANIVPACAAELQVSTAEAQLAQEQAIQVQTAAPADFLSYHPKSGVKRCCQLSYLYGTLSLELHEVQAAGKALC